MEAPTMRNIAIILLGVLDVDEKYPTADDNWAIHYMNENEAADHNGDCKNQPWTCCRCVCDEYKVKGTAALPLLEMLFKKKRRQMMSDKEHAETIRSAASALCEAVDAARDNDMPGENPLVGFDDPRHAEA